LIVYQSTKAQFLKHAFEDDIHDVVGAAYKERTGRRVSPSEFSAWKESLVCMAKVLNDRDIPDDSGVAIEYGIPGSAKRVDFIVSGFNEAKSPAVVIVELKRWDKARRTGKDAVVRTRYSGAEQDVLHPSYQAWSYAALLTGFNEAVYGCGMNLSPCAYLHNYTADGEIDHRFYEHYIEQSPLFLKGDAERNKLRSFIKRYVRHGDKGSIVVQIEGGRIRPSKYIADSIDRMLKGNQEFILVDDQKLIFEDALALAKDSSPKKKSVMIVEGGPGTGKSVVAVNLLAALTRLRKLARYVSKNAAPRTVYESKLTGKMRKTEISNLFSGSGVFTEGKPNEFDVLIVDEAHRLNEKSGLYQNLGDNQIKELISAASCSVFFIDENQRVTLKDIGRISEIERWATELGASVSLAKLESQFRCNGSDGYLAWLDETLGVNPTANQSFDRESFDFRIVDSPNALRDMIRAANKESNRARMVAGYCWNWISKKNPQEFDIVLPEHGFQARWNLSRDGSLWIVAPESVEEIGCIHTSQGLEVDYIGVIVGPDLIVRDGVVITVPESRAKTDKSLSGYKTRKQAGDAEVIGEADEVIKNTYRTLMTRGMKGCYVYFTDPEAAEHFKARLSKPSDSRAQDAVVAQPSGSASAAVLPFQRVERRKAKPYVDAVPLVNLKFAAGAFSGKQFQDQDHEEWAIIPKTFRPRKGLFVAQIVGESMNRRHANGAWCLFEVNPKGTRNGRVIVAEHRDISDPDTGGSYTVKLYHSTKEHRKDGTWRHLEVRLSPDSDDPTYKELILGPDAAGSVRIIAELIAEL
jgi:DUF2075 family protein/phage repressor protein C with HTH and peptisase S24 domain